MQYIRGIYANYQYGNGYFGNGWSGVGDTILVIRSN